MNVRLAALAAILAAHATPVSAELSAKFRDSSDGYFDLSDYLLRHRGVLPLPIVITEPAIGYGGGLGLAYFSQSFEERANASRARGEAVQPPDISIAVGIATENGTWAAGAGHMGFWDADRLRYTGGIGKVELHLDYYSVSGQPRAYRLAAGGLVQQLVRRIGSSNWFAGARYTYVTSKSSFDGTRPADVPERGLWDPLESTCRHASLSIL